MKHLIVVFFVFAFFDIHSQQLPERSDFEGNDFVWNPAMTAVRNYWDLAANYRQQWLGFDDAPSTAMITFQYPFDKQPMSAGVHIIQDNSHPIKFSSINFSYNYQIPLNIFKDDILSIGLMGSLGEFQVDSDGIVVGDNSDILLPNDEASSMIPNAGFGIYYTSEKDRFYNNGFYFGLGSQQLFGNDLIFDVDGSPLNIKRNLHANGVLGFSFLANEDLLVEPSIWTNYVNSKITDTTIGLILEKENTFWGGVSFATSQEFSFQAGVILKKGMFKDGQLRIGTLANYNMGTLGKQLGLGYEFYISYRFEVE